MGREEKIDKRRHIYPTRCYSCGERANRDGSALGIVASDAVTFFYAHCTDCNKLRRIGEVLANVLTPGDWTENIEARENLYRIIVTNMTESKEIRGYLGIPEDKKINVEAIVKEEDDLDQRVKDFEEANRT